MAANKENYYIYESRDLRSPWLYPCCLPTSIPDSYSVQLQPHTIYAIWTLEPHNFPTAPQASGLERIGSSLKVAAEKDS